mmetsp:Transcript_9626/g.30844  ORF Transcript_9626/g.30844 Transcript_9626/m.30844 type:complete len:205 (+) Transcript_9626:119-733(+)
MSVLQRARAARRARHLGWLCPGRRRPVAEAQGRPSQPSGSSSSGAARVRGGVRDRPWGWRGEQGDVRKGEEGQEGRGRRGGEDSGTESGAEEGDKKKGERKEGGERTKGNLPRLALCCVASRCGALRRVAVPCAVPSAGLGSGARQGVPPLLPSPGGAEEAGSGRWRPRARACRVVALRGRRSVGEGEERGSGVGGGRGVGVEF